MAGKGLSNENERAAIAGSIAGAKQVHELAELYGATVILHTDHCAKKLLPWIDGLLDASEKFYAETGKPLYSSHMIDLSEEPIEENIFEEELKTHQTILTPPKQQNAAIAKNENQESFESVEIVSQKESLEDQKVSEIVAQINELKSKGQTVTDADIDALLEKAQREITFQTILKEDTRTVDASALLQDVESDLQKSFRNKIFEALKNSYETVKTAVAERNN